MAFSSNNEEINTVNNMSTDFPMLSINETTRKNSYASVIKNFNTSDKSILNQSFKKDKSRFRTSTLNDIHELDLNTQEITPPPLIEWTEETLANISEKFNNSIPRSLFNSFKRFFSQRSIIISATDSNCSLYRFPRQALYEAITSKNLWETISKIGDLTNPRYIAIEFFEIDQKQRFQTLIKTIDNYALITVDENKQNIITGILKNAYFSYKLQDFQNMMKPFGQVLRLKVIYSKDTPIPIATNNFEFIIKLHLNIDPNSIPTQILDQEAMLCLYIRGLKPKCYACGLRGHLAIQCKDFSIQQKYQGSQSPSHQIQKQDMINKDTETNTTITDKTNIVLEREESTEDNSEKNCKNKNIINEDNITTNTTIQQKQSKTKIDLNNIDSNDGITNPIINNRSHIIINKTSTEIMDTIIAPMSIIETQTQETKRKTVRIKTKPDNKKIKTDNTDHTDITDIAAENIQIEFNKSPNSIKSKRNSLKNIISYETRSSTTQTIPQDL